MLSQRNEAGDDNPIAYSCMKLQPHEEHYSDIENECLAIKLAIQAFQMYLIGRHFTIEIDHRSLVWMDKLKDSNSPVDSLELLNATLQFPCGPLCRPSQLMGMPMRCQGSSCASNE